MINEDVREIVEAELRDGEELLWANRPIRALDYNYILLFILSIFGVYLVVSLEWLITEPISEIKNEFPWVLPLIFGVTFLSTIRFWLIKSEVYAITNKNIFIYSTIPTKNIHKVPFKSLTKVKQSFFFGSNTINLTLKGKDAYNSQVPVFRITFGFWTRVIVQLKQLSNPRVPFDIISKHMDAAS